MRVCRASAARPHLARTAPRLALARRSAYFAVYQSCKQALLANVHAPPLLLIAISAIFANTIAVTFRVPCELVKQRIQAGVYPSVIAAVRQIHAANGIGGFLPRQPWLAQLARDLRARRFKGRQTAVRAAGTLWLPAAERRLPFHLDPPSSTSSVSRP